MTTTWKDGRVSHGDASRPFKLGCKPRPKGVKAPLGLMSRFFLKDIPAPPGKVYREFKIPADAWGMFSNDSIGDCTVAAIAHMLMLVTSHTGKLIIPDPKDVIEFYSAVSGYDPATGANDNGSDLPTVLNRWMNVGLSGHKILAWADISIADANAQKQGIYIFGATDDAVNLPASAMDAFQNNKPWADAADANIEGGHSIPRFGYGADGATCVTWAKPQPGTWAWWQAYLMESCVVVTQDWIDNATGLAPNAMNMDSLNKALTALKG